MVAFDQPGGRIRACAAISPPSLYASTQPGHEWFEGEPSMNQSTGAKSVDVVELVRAAHEQAGVELCCDPQDLVRGLGIGLCPWPTEHSYVKGQRLYFPTARPRLESNRSIVCALAAHLGSDVDAIAHEIALPRAVAAQISFADLVTVQPHYSLEWLQAIFSRYKRMSGIVPRQ